ncbi:hypothetical protein [Streptomyces sp. NPDC023838]|uniref:hypothetical protein n=1 Tax=Streptomyces sp. NPDC023838 TaxID=3154325 RepID=UPI00340F5134
MPAPASPKDITAFEETVGHGTPGLLRRLYLEVPNGGFGSCQAPRRGELRHRRTAFVLRTAALSVSVTSTIARTAPGGPPGRQCRRQRPSAPTFGLVSGPQRCVLGSQSFNERDSRVALPAVSPYRVRQSGNSLPAGSCLSSGASGAAGDAAHLTDRPVEFLGGCGQSQRSRKA